jgi:hypothetical protein
MISDDDLMKTAEEIAKREKAQDEELKRLKEKEEARLAGELRLKKEEDGKLVEVEILEEMKRAKEAVKLAEEKRLKEEAAQKRESPKGDDKDTSTFIESSQSSPLATQLTSSTKTSDKSIKKPTNPLVTKASRKVKKVVKMAR